MSPKCTQLFLRENSRGSLPYSLLSHPLVDLWCLWRICRWFSYWSWLQRIGDWTPWTQLSTTPSSTWFQSPSKPALNQHRLRPCRLGLSLGGTVCRCCRNRPAQPQPSHFRWPGTSLVLPSWWLALRMFWVPSYQVGPRIPCKTSCPPPICGRCRCRRSWSSLRLGGAWECTIGGNPAWHSFIGRS